MQLIEELREEIARRQQFTMMVAHEMRNLLAPLTTGVELLVEQHGGTLCAYSAGPGKGSEFIVRLPVAANR